MIDRPPPRTHSADEVRGAEIELRTRWQRIVFIGGLALAVLFALLLGGLTLR
jgi:hypothetical protein